MNGEFGRYTLKVKERFLKPKFAGRLNGPNVFSAEVGSAACGDIMSVTLRINKKGIILDGRFKAFGCPSAFSAIDLFIELILKQHISFALNFKSEELFKMLELPKIKYHCTVISLEVVHLCIANYLKTQNKNIAPNATDIKNITPDTVTQQSKPEQRANDVLINQNMIIENTALSFLQKNNLQFIFINPIQNNCGLKFQLQKIEVENPQMFLLKKEKNISFFGATPFQKSYQNLLIKLEKSEFAEKIHVSKTDTDKCPCGERFKDNKN